MTAAPPPYFPYDVEALNAALQKNMNYRFACDIAAAVEEGNFSRALQTLGSMGVRHSQTYNRKRHNPLSAVADQPHPVPGMQEVIRQHAAEIDEDIARTQQAPKNGASTEFDQLIDLLADGKAEEALAELDRVMPRHAERFVLSAQPEVIRAYFAEMLRSDIVPGMPEDARSPNMYEESYDYRRKYGNRSLAHRHPLLDSGALEGADLQGMRIQGSKDAPYVFPGLMGYESGILCLTGADLAGAVIRHARLPMLVLKNAHAPGAVFHGVAMEHTSFENAQAVGAQIIDSNLILANLENANFTRTVIESTGVIDSDAGFKDFVVMEGVFLEGASLAGARLKGVNMLRANDCTWHESVAGAKVAYAISERDAAIGSLDLEMFDHPMTTPEERHLRHQYIRNTHRFAPADWTEANLQNVLLSGADLRGHDFTRARFYNVDFATQFIVPEGQNSYEVRGANLSEAVFDGAYIAFSPFCGATLNGTVMKDSIVLGCDFGAVTFGDEGVITQHTAGAVFADMSISNTSFFAVGFNGAAFVNTTIEGGQLVEVDMANAVLENVTIRGVDLRYVNGLENASLRGVVFEDCLFSREQARYLERSAEASITGQPQFSRADILALDRKAEEIQAILRQDGGEHPGRNASFN